MLNYTAMVDLFLLTDRWSWLAACPFCRIPSNLSPHKNQQGEHDFVNQKWLETAMYFFLHHLTFVDLCDASNVIPGMLVHFLPSRKTISFWLFFSNSTFHRPGHERWQYAYSDGLWLLHGHLQVFVIDANTMSTGICLFLVVAPYINGFANGLHGPSGCIVHLSVDLGDQPLWLQTQVPMSKKLPCLWSHTLFWNLNMLEL